MMNFFVRRKQADVEIIQESNAPVVVAVPDIKEYLVKEYERASELMLKIAQLEEEVEASREIKLQYDAALVTLDEYSKRLKRAESTIKDKDLRITQMKLENDRIRDELNSFRIQFNEIALTTEQIKDEIEAKTVEALKARIVRIISELKGNVSKKQVCEIVSNVIFD